MLESIFSYPVTLVQMLIVIGCALVAGVLMSLVFSYKSRSSTSFSLAMVMLPVAMTMVVLVINGNLGVAVAVAGGFALVRFRSIAGTAREICAIFIDMTIGVILGMGYITAAAIFFVVCAVMVIILTVTGFGSRPKEKLLKITLPEDYDYTDLFDDVFEKYRVKSSIEKIKTTNMGSLIDVTYRIQMPSTTMPKEMLDDLRSRNANLTIMIMSADDAKDAL